MEVSRKIQQLVFDCLGRSCGWDGMYLLQFRAVSIYWCHMFHETSYELFYKNNSQIRLFPQYTYQALRWFASKKLIRNIYDIEDTLVDLAIDCLPNNQKLRKLVINVDTLSEKKFLSLAQALTKNTSLQKLVVRAKKFSEGTGEIFAQALRQHPNLRELKLSCPYNPSIIESLLENKQICKLGLHWEIGKAAQCQKILLANSSIRELSCSWDSDDNEDDICDFFSTLAENITLREFSISCCDFSEKVVTAITNMLKRNNGLQKLMLFENMMGDNECAEIISGLYYNTSLLCLKIENNIPGKKTLTELGKVLTFNQTLREALIYVWYRYKISLNGLQKVYISWRQNRSLQKFSPRNPLDKVRFPICNLTAYELSQTLRIKKNLYHLDLSVFESNSKQTEDILRALDVDNNLLSLKLGSGNKMDIMGIRLLAEYIRKNKTLRTLKFSYNDVITVNNLLIIQALGENISLHTVCFNGFFNFCSSAIFLLSETLRINKTLRQLSLKTSSFHKRDMYALGDALTVNRGLRKLYIKEGYSPKHCIEGILEKLHENCVLRELHVMGKKWVPENLRTTLEKPTSLLLVTVNKKIIYRYGKVSL